MQLYCSERAGLLRSSYLILEIQKVDTHHPRKSFCCIMLHMSIFSSSYPLDIDFPYHRKKLLLLPVDQKGYNDAMPLRRVSVHVNTSVCLVCIFKCLCNEGGELVKWSWFLLCSGCWDGIGEELYSVYIFLSVYVFPGNYTYDLLRCTV